MNNENNFNNGLNSGNVNPNNVNPNVGVNPNINQNMVNAGLNNQSVNYNSNSNPNMGISNPNSVNHNVTQNSVNAGSNNQTVSSNVETSQNMNSNSNMNATSNQNNLNQSVNQNSNNETVNLVETFVGKKYNKMLISKFNVPALLFGEYYFLYRKMYLYAFLIILSGVVVSLVPFGLGFIALRIVLGFFTNKLYINFANKKVEKIKLKNQSPNDNELTSICAKKGGVNIPIVIIFLVIQVVILVAVASVASSIILKIIGKLKDDADLNQAYGIVSTAELYYTENYSKNGNFLETTFECDGYSCSTASGDELSIKGGVPKSGSIKITASGEINTINDLQFENSDTKYKIINSAIVSN